jgi:hypothetical protein
MDGPARAETGFENDQKSRQKRFVMEASRSEENVASDLFSMIGICPSGTCPIGLIYGLLRLSRLSLLSRTRLIAPFADPSPGPSKWNRVLFLVSCGRVKDLRDDPHEVAFVLTIPATNYALGVCE